MSEPRASEERLSLALRAARQGAWEFDLRDGSGYRSPELRALLGVQHGQPTLADYLGNVHEQDRPLILAAFQRLRSGELQESVLQYRFVRDDAQVIWVEQHTFVERDDTGAAMRLYGLSRDITAIKETELALQRSNATLEARVAARTRELEAERAALLAANAELEAFAYSVSHDLRAPVRHIKGFAELAQRDARQRPVAEEKLHHHLEVIQQSADRMNTLIDAMLDLSRTSRRPLQPGRVALGALVEQARSELTPELQDRCIEWDVPELPEVHGDPTTLQQVVTNLLSNAVKFTRGRPVAQIRVRAEAWPHEWVVSVQDNGAGFEAGQQDRLFGVFQRLHSQREFEGVGVGLANVRRIVARHGGRVFAHGQPDEGATFGFALPRQDALCAEQETEQLLR